MTEKAINYVLVEKCIKSSEVSEALWKNIFPIFSGFTYPVDLACWFEIGIEAGRKLYSWTGRLLAFIPAGFNMISSCCVTVNNQIITHATIF